MEAPDRFSDGRELDLVADVLADPTRRRIFRHVSDSPRPISAAEIAQAFGIHRTVARGHLERLVESDLLHSRPHRHQPKGGRPPKIYYRSERRIDLQLPARQYELLAGLLVEALSRFGDAAAVMLRQIGLEFGRRLSAGADGEGWEARLGVMARSGARVEITRVDDEHLELEIKDCLFREISHTSDGLICGLDRAIFEGLLAGVDGESFELKKAERRTPEKDVCRLRFLLKKPSPPGSGREANSA